MVLYNVVGIFSACFLPSVDV